MIAGAGGHGIGLSHRSLTDWLQHQIPALLGVVDAVGEPAAARIPLIRELKEGFWGWLSSQLLPPHPTIADYDALVRLWIQELVLRRAERSGLGSGRPTGSNLCCAAAI